MYDFDAKWSSRGFATPRSWGFVSNLLENESALDNETLFTLVAGSVGEGLATKFMAHRKIASKLPTAEDILSGKVTELEIKEISAMYSLTISMCYEMKDMYDNKRANSKQFHEMVDNFISYMMKNFDPELIIMGAKIAMQTYDLDIDFTKLKNYTEFHKKYSKFILGAVKR